APAPARLRSRGAAARAGSRPGSVPSGRTALRARRRRRRRRRPAAPAERRAGVSAECAPRGPCRARCGPCCQPAAAAARTPARRPPPGRSGSNAPWGTAAATTLRREGPAPAGTPRAARGPAPRRAAPPWGRRRSLDLDSNPAQDAPRNYRFVHLVGSVVDACGTLVPVPVRERRVVGDPQRAVHLHGFVEHVLED